MNIIERFRVSLSTNFQGCLEIEVKTIWERLTQGEGRPDVIGRIYGRFVRVEYRVEAAELISWDSFYNVLGQFVQEQGFKRKIKDFA